MNWQKTPDKNVKPADYFYEISEKVIKGRHTVHVINKACSAGTIYDHNQIKKKC